MRVVSAHEAARDIIAALRVQPPLRMPLLDACSRVLGEDVHATIDLPPWTNASMDGYAAYGDDVRGAGPDRAIRLRIVDTIAAGASAGPPLGRGETARIFTGAPLPAGADTVVRQEDTRRDGAWVVIERDRDAGANVRRAGGDLPRGALALAAGTIVGPRQVALLAALAVAHPMVHRGPRVGILSGGDEVVSLDHPDEILSGRRQADVNGPALAALVREAGGIAVPLGIAADDPAAIRKKIDAGDDVDLLISAGGVSVGDHDHVRTVMADCRVRLVFDRVRIRPGGPTTFGTFPDGRGWLALPGNPVSAMVTFELFGRPAIRKMAGHRDPLARTRSVTLRADARRDAALDQYLRVQFTRSDHDDLLHATPTGAQGSGMLTSMARADGLVIIPAGDGVIPAGSTVDALIFSRQAEAI